MPKINGKWIHHNDCTWCQHRNKIAMKNGRKWDEMERCGKTGQPIPTISIGGRFCDHYQQLNCDCPLCDGV